jgi:hypothetical protein
MTLNKSAWTILNLSYVPTSQESLLSNCSTIDLGTTVQLSITVSNVYSVDNSSAARVKLYTSNNNLTWDTDAYATFDNAFTANTSKRTTVPVCPDPRYMKASVYNQNAAGNISAVLIICTQKYIS